MGIAVRRELVRKVDIDAVFKAIEIIAGQTMGTNPLRVTDGAAYAIVTKKGTNISMFSFHFFFLSVLFNYCYKYCYSDSRKLWAVMKAGGLAL